MTDETTEGARLGDVLDALVGTLTKEQFAALAQRTGHGDTKAEATKALSQLVTQDNIATGSTADVLAFLQRQGR